MWSHLTMFVQVLVLLAPGPASVSASDSITYNVTTLLNNLPQGALRQLIQDPHNEHRLLSVGLDSAIYEITLSGSTSHQVSVWAGTPGKPTHQDGARLGEAHFHKPGALCMLPGTAVDVLVADSGSATIRHISASTGQVTTVAGQPYKRGIKDGPGSEALFGTPMSLACLPAGQALIGDPNTQSLRLLKCSMPSALSSITQGSSSSSSGDGDDMHAVVNAPAASTPECSVSTVLRLRDTKTHGLFAHLALDPSNPSRLLISDGHTSVWEMSDISDPGSLQLYAGEPGPASPRHADGPRTSGAAFNTPHQLCVMSAAAGGHVMVAETVSATVRHIHATTGEVTTIAGQPYQQGDQDGRGDQALLSSPTSLVCSSSAAGQLLLGEQPTAGHAALRRLDCTSGCSTAPGPSPGGGDDDDDDHDHKGDQRASQRHAAVWWVSLGSALGLFLGLGGAAWYWLPKYGGARMALMHHKHRGPPHGYERLEAGLLGHAHEHAEGSQHTLHEGPPGSADLLHLQDADLLGQEVTPAHPHHTIADTSDDVTTSGSMEAVAAAGPGPVADVETEGGTSTQAAHPPQAARSADLL